MDGWSRVEETQLQGMGRGCIEIKAVGKVIEGPNGKVNEAPNERTCMEWDLGT